MTPTLITSIIVAVLGMVGSLMGTYLSNRKSTALMAYRLEQLEGLVKEHNNYARHMPVIEEQIKVINHRIADLETQK